MGFLEGRELPPSSEDPRESEGIGKYNSRRSPERNAIPSERLRESEVHHKVERGLSNFFKETADRLIEWTTKTAVTAIISAALSPIFGPVVAGIAGVGVSAATTSMHKELRSLSPNLRGDTVNKLVEPLQGKPFDETELRKVIGKVSSEDRQANEDLKQFYIDLQPTIEKAYRSTNITITGDVGNVIVGDKNTIEQTFSSFLQDKSAPRNTVWETTAPRLPISLDKTDRELINKILQGRESINESGSEPINKILQGRRRTGLINESDRERARTSKSRRRSPTPFRRPINRDY